MSRNFFDGLNSVFANKDILQIDYVVDESRIIGRDDQLEALAQSLQPALEGSKPNNCLLFGKPGTGKSLCAKFITKQLQREATANDVSIGRAYVDCAQSNTETGAITEIGQMFNTDGSDVSIPDTGLATNTVYNRAWDALEENHDVGIVILDEIDKHRDYNSLLMQLSRAGEANKLNSSSLGIIAISNKPRFKNKLQERTLSSLNERGHIFPPYEPAQLEQILNARKDAYKDGVLESDVIPLAAAKAGSRHGDARKAMDIFRYAGEVANKAGSDTVKRSHVEQGFEEAEVEEILQIISRLPPHSRLVIQSVAALSADRDTTADPVTTTEAYELYQRKCNFDATDALSERRVRDLLKEAEFLEILSRKRKPAGHALGSETQITLIDDPEKVLRATKKLDERSDDQPA